MLKIGTRGSTLALAQAGDVARWLKEAGFASELVVISTVGDQKQDRPFAQVGAPGIFVREIESALLDGRVDLAVHSYKDLTSQMPDGLKIGAVPERLDPADHLLVQKSSHLEGKQLFPLPTGAVIGTASARRKALIAHHRPDLKTKMLRGNVPTRIKQLRDGKYDAILLAGAGLKRLERSGVDLLLGNDIIDIRLDPMHFVPAPSQGALALQIRRGDSTTEAAAAAVESQSVSRQVACERALLALVEGGCQLPFGAYCLSDEQGLTLRAFLEVEGKGQFCTVEGPEPDSLAQAAWAALKTWEGARPWLAPKKNA